MAQDSQRGASGYHNKSEGEPKVDPKEAKGSPKPAKGVVRWAKLAKVGPKGPQRTPKAIPRAPQRTQSASKAGAKDIKGTQAKQKA